MSKKNKQTLEVLPLAQKASQWLGLEAFPTKPLSLEKKWDIKIGGYKTLTVKSREELLPAIKRVKKALNESRAVAISMGLDWSRHPSQFGPLDLKLPSELPGGGGAAPSNFQGPTLWWSMILKAKR